jgi:hypothetical protein
MTYKLVNPYTNIEYSSNKDKLESAQEIWNTLSKNTINFVPQSYFTLQKGGEYSHFTVEEKKNKNDKISYKISEFTNEKIDNKKLKKQLNSQKGAGKYNFSNDSTTFSSSNSSSSSLSDSSDDSSSSSSLSTSSSSYSNSPILEKNKRGIVYKFKNRDRSTYTKNLNKVIYYDIYGLKYIIPTFKKGIEIIFTTQ